MRDADILVAFGQLIAELRTERGWTVAQLAERSGLGATAIEQFESGRTSAALSSMRQLAGAFGVPLSRLFEFENRSEPGSSEG